MKIIDGKKIRDEILAKVKNEVAALPFQPVFCDVLVGDDPASAPICTNESSERRICRY